MFVRTDGFTDGGLMDGDGWETAPTFEKEFRNTHARASHTTTCSVRVAPPPTQTRGIRRDYRGTQIDADDSRGTRHGVTYVVTSCDNRPGRGGSILARRKMTGTVR